RRGVGGGQQGGEGVGFQKAGGGLQKGWGDKKQTSVVWEMGFFFEVLSATRLFCQWGGACALFFKSPHRGTPPGILGTWMLSILSGHWRYAHVSAIRADGVNPGLLGMSAVVAEDTLRRGLKAIDENAGTQWLWRHIGRTVLGLLEAPWILDVDVTI